MAYVISNGKYHLGVDGNGHYCLTMSADNAMRWDKYNKARNVLRKSIDNKIKMQYGMEVKDLAQIKSEDKGFAVEQAEEPKQADNVGSEFTKQNRIVCEAIANDVREAHEEISGCIPNEPAALDSDMVGKLNDLYNFMTTAGERKEWLVE